MTFAEAAQQAFSFLESRGFRVVKTEDNWVEYRSARTVVVIEWMYRSDELDVYFGPVPAGDVDRHGIYSLLGLLRMNHITPRGPGVLLDRSETARLPEFLESFAADTREHAQAALAGDPAVFAQLEAYGAEQLREAERDMQRYREQWEAAHPSLGRRVVLALKSLWQKGGA